MHCSNCLKQPVFRSTSRVVPHSQLQLLFATPPFGSWSALQVRPQSSGRHLIQHPEAYQTPVSEVRAHRAPRSRGQHLCRAAGDATAPYPSASAPPLGPVLLSVAVACAGAFAFGYNLGVVNGPLEQIARDLGFFGNTASEGMVVSSIIAGAAAGSMTGGALSDALGRRLSFLLAAVPMAAGPLISASATSLQAMVMGRALTGVAIGLSSALVPTYISEVAPASIRGTLGTLNQLCICLGILGALIVNVAIPPASWSTMFSLAAVPAAVLGLGMLLSPESPRWLASKGRMEGAAAAARQLWGEAGAQDLASESAAAADKASGAVADGAAPPSSAKPMIMGVLLFAFQQFAGINALVYFSSMVFKQAGVTNGSLASAAVGATNVLGTLIAASLMDKAGRKQLLTNSFLGQAAAMFVMAAGLGLAVLQPYAGAIAISGTLAYILAFALGAGPVPALLVPELNPLKTRGQAVAMAFVSHWICNTVLGQNFLVVVKLYGLPAVYTGFGCVALAGALYVSKQVPETKGKTLEQIEAELGP